MNVAKVLLSVNIITFKTHLKPLVIMMGPRWTHTLSLLTPGVLPITDLTVRSITVYVFITHVHVHFVLTCKKLQISYQKIQMATCFMSSGNTTKSQAHSPRVPPRLKVHF